MPNLLLFASCVGLGASTAALWVQRWQRADHRFFAGLVSIAVTMSLFSVVTWAAIAIAPLPLTGLFVGTLALLFALRLYRKLQKPPQAETVDGISVQKIYFQLDMNPRSRDLADCCRYQLDPRFDADRH